MADFALPNLGENINEADVLKIQLASQFHDIGTAAVRARSGVDVAAGSATAIAALVNVIPVVGQMASRVVVMVALRLP